jgi:DNA-binding MarR family transcriptional regulator
MIVRRYYTHVEQPRVAPAPRIPSIGFLLSSLGWSTAKRFRETLEPFGLEPREFATLRALAGADGQSQQAVCSALSIPPSRMVGLVDTLEERGLVERHLNASDRRARAIHVTPQGRELLERIGENLGKGERWLCQPLSAAERETLLELLNRLADQFELSADVHPDMSAPRAMPWPGAPTGGRRSGARRDADLRDQ